jgi:hypothetical protein
MHFPKIMAGKQKILVISPLCDQIEKLTKIQSFKDEYITVFTGEICYPWDSIDQVKYRIEILDKYLKNSSSFYIVGDGDLNFKSKNKNNDNKINKWIDNQCLGINITFENNSMLTVVHGGIPIEAKSWKDIVSNIEIAFVKNINGQPWHKLYDGKFGYVISAHPTSNELKQYNFSSAIDIQGQVLAQEYSENGLGTTILL